MHTDPPVISDESGPERPKQRSGRQPVVGITCDRIPHNGVLRDAAGVGYAEHVRLLGGLPVLLSPGQGTARGYVDLCDAVLLTGGDDPDMTAFGEPNHAAAVLVAPERQAFELEVLRELDERAPEKPVLGVCLGMQWMVLVAGGTLDQHMPDTLATAEEHWERVHEVFLWGGLRDLIGRDRVEVSSKHRQRVIGVGSLEPCGKSPDQVIEAVCDPRKPFSVGVQWHPERRPFGSPEPDPSFVAFMDAAKRCMPDRRITGFRT